MDPTLVTIFVAIVTVLLGGGGVVMWWLNRRKNKAEGASAEIESKEAEVNLSLIKSEAYKRLESMVRELISEKVDAHKENYRLELANSNLEVLLKIQKDQNDILQNNLFEVLREQGEARGREKHCQEELAKRRQEIRELRDDLEQLKSSLKDRK